MLDEMRVNDEQLDQSDIRQLENADEITHFFAKLCYGVDERTNIPDYAVLGMGSADMRQHIHKIELIGKDPEDGDISIYLFEVRSVTAKLRHDIARRFRERPENALLVLTQDYEELEFVLLERVISRSQSRRAALRQAIRPIPLTVNRLHPDPIALRVLKRFTFTEEDAAYQWEKLRSAYMLAEWSEEYFNNRALFSDYYLKERLTDPKITPQWDENVRPVGREIYKHIVTARKNYTRQPAEVIRKSLYEPVFKLLGFDFERKKARSSSIEQADYLLYTPGNKSKPIAAALTYVWNRNLDDIDPTRDAEEIGGTPFDIPGAIVVSLLEAQVAPWVIVTSGKLWRLYSSTASNKATNYYEIDLEEAVAANDQIIALKYWWLMFRQQAFTGFLDNLLKNSTDYAKKLGEQLKDRVFTEIFPQFAQGFIADMRAKGVSNLDEETLATVFSGTMTFLYRLMFILYAESLELLPLSEVRGYREHSLHRMKHEIADAGGTVGDEAADKLSKQYKTSSTELYDRLEVLFTVIDQGSDEINMPSYNGGLFSQETDSGKFLATYAIPDSYLARGLDWLTRDDILHDMERQKVTIDAARLTRVALLKRAVLKRCVYGVDLNQMAVELAKVSLWLDAFTLGAPLSFLDHHLKPGNSLIGARVADVQKALEGELTLFSRNKFAGVMLATDLMRQVSYLSDNTVEQMHRSAQAYRDARDHLAPYKRVLDVYTSRWFGNTPSKNKKGNALDPTIEFLRRNDTQAWLEDPHNLKNALLDDDYMQAGLVAQTALQTAEGKRFFHWELEFPEVFFSPSKPGGRDVQLREDAGFDAAVGNPPYSSGRDWGQGNEKSYLSDAFGMAEYQLDLYQLFIESLINLLRPKGLQGLIIPDTWTQSVYAGKLRDLVLRSTTIRVLVSLKSEVFSDASVDTIIAIFQKDISDTTSQISVYICHGNIAISIVPEYIISQLIFQDNYGNRIDFLTSLDIRKLLEKLLKNTTTVDELFETTRGINAYDKARGQSTEVIATRAYHSDRKKTEQYSPELMGADTGRYEIAWDGRHWIMYGNWLAAPREPRFFNQTKLLVRKILSNGRIVALIDDDKYYVDQQLYIAIPRVNDQEIPSLWYSVTILNSTVTNYVYLNRYRESGVLFPQITVEAFTQLPIPRITFTTPFGEREGLTREAVGAYDLGDNTGVLQRVRQHIDGNKTDVVHDLLAHLAQCMIDLNTQNWRGLRYRDPGDMKRS